MAPNNPIPHQAATAGQAVRGPSPGDGIGHALRRSFGHERQMPAEWAACLAAIDRASRH